VSIRIVALLLRRAIRFDVGQLRATPGAIEKIDENDFFNCFVRHMAGDWGDLDEHDWKANDDAVEFDSRIISVYEDRCGIRFWIITEADRSSTTILLPEEY
jgi:hypothetical protein